MMANLQHPVILGPGMRKLLSVKADTDSSTEPITGNVSGDRPPAMNEYGCITFTISHAWNTVDLIHSGNVDNGLLIALAKTAREYLSRNAMSANANETPSSPHESSKSCSVDGSSAFSIALASLEELDRATGEASEILPSTSEVTADKDSSDCNVSIELGESDSTSTASESEPSTDDTIVCGGTMAANEKDIVQDESREPAAEAFGNMFNENLARTLLDDDSALEDAAAEKRAYEALFQNIRKEESLETLIAALNFSAQAILSEVDMVADEEEELSDPSGQRSVRGSKTRRARDCIVKDKLSKILRRSHMACEDEMKTDLKSEEPSLSSRNNEEALTVEPHEDVKTEGSDPQPTDSLETEDVRSPTPPEHANEAVSEESKSIAPEIPVQSENEVVCNDVQSTAGVEEVVVADQASIANISPNTTSPSSQCSSKYSMIRYATMLA